MPPRFSAPGAASAALAAGWLVGSAARKKRILAGCFCAREHVGGEFGNGINDGSIRLKSDAAGGLGERCNPMQDC